MHRRDLLVLVGTVSVSGLAGCLGGDGGDGETEAGTTAIPTGTLTRPRDLIVENLHEDPQTIQLEVIKNGDEEFHSEDYQLDSGQEVVEEEFVTEKGLYTMNIRVDMGDDAGGGTDADGTTTGTGDGVLTEEFLWKVDASAGNALVTLTSNGTLLTSGKM